MLQIVKKKGFYGGVDKKLSQIKIVTENPLLLEKSTDDKKDKRNRS